MSITVKFNNVADGSSASLTLYSHYTCLYGKESGEGKSHFFEEIEEGVSTGDIRVEISNGMPFTLATPATIGAILGLAGRTVIMIDESSMLKDDIIKRVNKSKHIFICIFQVRQYCYGVCRG